MARARAIAIGAAALLLLMPLGARADTIEVEVRNVELRPAGVGAAANDTIRFRVTSGTHDLRSYAGVAFNPGPMTASQTIDVAFPGGTSRYRCVVPGHSSLTGDACSGMCGVISSTPPSIPPPVITSPADGATVGGGGTTVSGTASAPATRVQLFDGNNFLGDAAIEGGAFSRGFSFAAGEHTLTAIALDPDGFRSPPSAPVTFTVDGTDVGPPAVVLSQPSSLVAGNPLVVAGIATDDKLLASVDIEIRNLVTGELITPEADCPACGSPSSTFHAQIPVPRGLHEVTAIAFDGLGRSGAARATVLVL